MPTARRIACIATIIVPIFAAPAATAWAAESGLVTRGEYLARAGDCMSCHTNPGGAPFAGGRQVETPFGSISSPNITPDRDTGIGNWSDDDFYRLMHDGIDREGHYVYPVMPFDYYTKVTRDDVLAIKAFLFSQPPVHAPRPPGHLEFPFNIRTSLAGWRALFFKPGEFVADTSQPEPVQRGAYLVEGLGHCGACHTPRNGLGGGKPAEALGGGEITGQGWFAPNITSDVTEGIGGWSDAQLLDYLKTGTARGRSIAAGPMDEVVHTSLRYLTDQDLSAMVAYLKAIPAKELYRPTPSVEAATERPAETPGAAAYLDHCAFCHQPDGRGIEGAVPPLAGNGIVRAGGPEGVIRTILGGMPARDTYAAMPGLAKMIPSREIADIANYVRTSWGNAAPATATTRMVDRLARKTATMLAGTARCTPVAPARVARAIARPGIEPMLRQVTQVNMLEQIDAVLPRMQSAGEDLPRAEVVNGLTAAYCPIVMTDGTLRPLERLESLQRFDMLVYSRLSARDVAGQTAAAPK
jgi:mono/diheme cytochrome c family protein